MSTTNPATSSPAPLPALFLIRHGQTAWSLTGQHTGRTDLPLTQTGRAEAAKLAPRLQPVTFGRVFSSPRLRARETCQIAGLGSAMEIEPDLAEWDYGDYEGLLASEILQRRPGWNIYRDGCPGGESPAQISDRADRLISRLRPLAGNTALFSHGHFSRILTIRWLGLTVPDAACLSISTASLSILSYEQTLSRSTITLWNSTGNF
jgi:probable phosphoglycerate mutase